MGFVLRGLNLLFCSLHHKYEYSERSSLNSCISQFYTYYKQRTVFRFLLCFTVATTSLIQPFYEEQNSLRKRWVMSIMFSYSWSHPRSSCPPPSILCLPYLPSKSRGRKKGGLVEAHSSLSLCPVLGAGLCPVRARGRLSSICHCPSPLSEEGF